MIGMIGWNILALLAGAAAVLGLLGTGIALLAVGLVKRRTGLTVAGAVLLGLFVLVAAAVALAFLA